VKDDFNYEKIPLAQKNNVEMFTTSIFRCLRRKPDTCKIVSSIFKYLNFTFQINTNLGSIQIFASSVKKHDITI
jgi:hypothetical protein